MSARIDELDRLIDALNAHRDPYMDGPVDADLAELLDLVRGLKELDHTDWPDDSFGSRVSLNLATRLGSPLGFSNVDRDILTDDGEHEQSLPTLPEGSDSPRPTLLPHRQSTIRKSLEIAAAVVVLVAFTALMAVLIRGSGAGQISPTERSGQFGSTGTFATPKTAVTPTVSPSITPSPSVASAAATPTTVNAPALVSLQQAAGFDLFAPASLPQGLSLAHPNAPMSLPGFTSVALKYVDGDGTQALTITEASPYQDSAQTMPPDIWNNAVAVNIQGDALGSVAARLYQSDSDLQLWWQSGPTSVRFETGGAPGTKMLTKDQVMAIAISMAPVGSSTKGSNSSPSISPGAKVPSADDAIAAAHTLLGNIGGNDHAPSSHVKLAAVSDETALGMPRPQNSDPNAPVWSVEFAGGLIPANCQQLSSSNSLCSHGQITVIVDAMSGDVLGYYGMDGVWKQP